MLTIDLHIDILIYLDIARQARDPIAIAIAIAIAGLLSGLGAPIAYERRERAEI